MPKFRRLRKVLKRNRNVAEEDPLGGFEAPSRDNGNTSSAGRDTFTQDGVTYAEDQLLYLANEVKDYQLTHGSLLKSVEHESQNFAVGSGVGISILPTAFPAKCFEHAQNLQKAYNELYMNVASDPEWLRSIFEPLLPQDTFLKALWDIYLKVEEAGALQDIVCGIVRSDYMLHQPEGAPEPVLKQVEMNTFSCAGACHAERAAKMHAQLSHYRTKETSPDAALSTLPSNNNTDALVQGLRAAHEAYTPGGEHKTCILMTVQPYNFNIADERPIQYGLWDASIPCHRCEWGTILEQTTLTQDGTLLFRPPFGSSALEVSVVYYRSGYDASEYEKQSQQTRLRLEMSRAIKCPDILTHLTTFKIVQSALTAPEVLERFIPSSSSTASSSFAAFAATAPSSSTEDTTNDDNSENDTNNNTGTTNNSSDPTSAISDLRSTFMQMQNLDTTPSGTQARGLLTNPDEITKHVLKPNLEGGGHNIYGARIPDFLSTLPQERWASYTLMKLIEAPGTRENDTTNATTGTLMPQGELHHGDVVSELGILGTCLWRRKVGAGLISGDGEVGGGKAEVEVMRNECAGWTFKSKAADVEEMSVVKGFGCFDCPNLVG